MKSWLRLAAIAYGMSLAFYSCAQVNQESTTAPVSHELFTAMLQKHVNEDGMVNYADLQKDSANLNIYLQLLSANPPTIHWSKNEQLAFWINAYNAFTLQLIIRHYPIESIKDITSISIPFVHSPWDISFINIGDKEYDLNNIEHGIIREEFEEPRIHFALVCAAKSCPKLRNEAYEANKLDRQLQEQAVTFINGPKNQISPSKLGLSKIFLWYRGDFTSGQSLQQYLGQFSKIQVDEDAKINYLVYNWKLNNH